MHKFLYRGVNISIHNNDEGLKYKGTKFVREAQHGEGYVTHGSGVQHGSSSVNTIVAHQMDSSKFPSSGISTTPHFDIAKNYATYGDQKGVVYKISTEMFSASGIEAFTVKDWVPVPKIPRDEEVIIRHKTDDRISEDIIVEIIPVSP